MTNRQRAERAAKALIAADAYNNSGADVHVQVTDLIADLLHFERLHKPETLFHAGTTLSKAEYSHALESEAGWDDDTEDL